MLRYFTRQVVRFAVQHPMQTGFLVGGQMSLAASIHNGLSGEVSTMGSGEDN